MLATLLGVATQRLNHTGATKMNKETQLYKIVWTQVYEAWPVEPEVKQETEIVDLTQAREVLARIMAK